jgi:hypothetical protein
MKATLAAPTISVGELCSSARLKRPVDPLTSSLPHEGDACGADHQRPRALLVGASETTGRPADVIAPA